MIPFLGLDLKPILEIRERFERRVDRDFSRQRSDNTSDLLSRYRVGFGLQKGTFNGKLEYQYAHDEDWNSTQNFAAWRSDLVIAQVQDKFAKDANVTLGRQRLSFGTERLLGAAEWNNISNAWDGVHLNFKSWEAFAAKSGLASSPNNQLSIYGFAKSYGPTTQTLVVFKHDENGTGVDEATVSQNYRGKLGPFTLDAEAALQAGHRGDTKKLAGAIDVIASLPIAKKLTFSLQGSDASGGGNGDTNRTFDQLSPSGHDRHGLTDMTGWKNVRDLGLYFKYEANKQNSFKLQYHRFGLDSNTDAWYSSSGSANRGANGAFRDSSGESGRDIGSEVDIDYALKINAHQSFRAGFGLFMPGRFVKNLDSSTKDQNFGYVQWSYNF